jgi:hypothetical protein
MPDYRYKRCRLCHRSGEEVGDLSWQRLCIDCGGERRTANILQLNAHDGPWFDHWRRSMAASVGGVLLDDVTPNP